MIYIKNICELQHSHQSHGFATNQRLPRRKKAILSNVRLGSRSIKHRVFVVAFLVITAKQPGN